MASFVRSRAEPGSGRTVASSARDTDGSEIAEAGSARSGICWKSRAGPVDMSFNCRVGPDRAGATPLGPPAGSGAPLRQAAPRHIRVAVAALCQRFSIAAANVPTRAGPAAAAVAARLIDSRQILLRAAAGVTVNHHNETARPGKD